MNIISGIARGIKLSVPKGLDVRPTSALARKAIFDKVRNWRDLVVVDLFAGSGALGLEAASRGARQVFFSENNPKHCKFLSENIDKVKKAGVDGVLELIKCDSLKIHKIYSHLEGKIDIIFADPPYNDAKVLLNKIFSEKSFSKWAAGAMFILECPSEKSRKPLIEEFDHWKVVSIKSKGQSDFYYFKNNYGNVGG